MTQTPTIGRIVHYHSYGTPGGEFKPEPRAAIIVAADPTKADAGVITVCVLNPTGIFFNEVSYSDKPEPGCWTWPPRVGA